TAMPGPKSRDTRFGPLNVSWSSASPNSVIVTVAPAPTDVMDVLVSTGEVAGRLKLATCRLSTNVMPLVPPSVTHTGFDGVEALDEGPRLVAADPCNRSEPQRGVNATSPGTVTCRFEIRICAGPVLEEDVTVNERKPPPSPTTAGPSSRP